MMPSCEAAADSLALPPAVLHVRTLQRQTPSSKLPLQPLPCLLDACRHLAQAGASEPRPCRLVGHALNRPAAGGAQRVPGHDQGRAGGAQLAVPARVEEHRRGRGHADRAVLRILILPQDVRHCDPPRRGRGLAHGRLSSLRSLQGRSAVSAHS